MPQLTKDEKLALFRDNAESIGESFEERRDAFKREFSLVKEWFDALSTEDGDIGAAFNKALAKTGCREEFNNNSDFTWGQAAYVASLATPGFFGKWQTPTTKFSNKIHYLPGCFNNRVAFFSMRAHEGVHAIQTHKAPYMHANPLNYTRTGICLSPRAYLLNRQLQETDAYAKQVWLTALLAEQAPHLDNPFKKGMLVDTGEFRKFDNGKDNFATALSKTGLSVMARAAYFNGSKEAHVTGNQYIEQDLRLYGRLLNDARHQMAKAPAVFCRLTPEDVVAIGESFGPNIFTVNGRPLPPYTELQHSDARTEALIKDMERKLGIEDDADLPTFEEALKMRGLTREAFMAIVKDERKPPSRLCKEIRDEQPRASLPAP